jgi:BirA family transcriptional regulator, biotin operon repressor / biotin---[acetyl-CoA-carboxylase] ligase
MQQNELFSILDSVESTNNYAMQQVHEGLATNGQAWFANNQWGGKGQRGKKWASNAGENIIFSMVIKPHTLFASKPFCFSMLVALVCRDYFAQFVQLPIKVKWPNDIYFNDRKAGGILIENIFTGNKWQWATIGIGINVNQVDFETSEFNATSIKKITGNSYDPISLAKELHFMLFTKMGAVTNENVATIVADFNNHLYKKNEVVVLKKDTAVFKTTIIGVNDYGELITNDAIERKFEVGEVEWQK